jgi:hypothetical protein
MKIGPDAPDESGKKSARKKQAIEAQQTAPEPPKESPSVDPSMQRLSQIADKTRRDLVDKAALQTSMKDKLLISRNRAAEIRQRIQAGYYGRPEVVRSIADRLADYLEP